VAPQNGSGKRSPWLLGVVAIATVIWLMPSGKPKTVPSFQAYKAEAATVPAPFNETVSGWLCDDAIRRHVSHPSTIDFRSSRDYAPDAPSAGVRVIWQTFSAKNNDGLELTYRGRCEVSPDGHLDSIVINEK
jgi:hypothetical protein